jgi:hypothetical protein
MAQPLTPEDDTWSIVFVPYTNLAGGGGPITLQSNGVITMKSHQLLNFMYGPVANTETTKDTGVAQADADLVKVAGVADDANPGLDYGAADAGAGLMAALTAPTRPADAAIGAGDNQATAMPVPVNMTQLYGDGYLSRFFSEISGVQLAKQKNITQCFFRAIERRVAIVAAGADLPPAAAGAAALRASISNSVNNFAYLLLLRYQGGAGVPPANYAKHSDVYYKKYMQNSQIEPGPAEPAAPGPVAGAPSFLTSLFNVFSLITPGAGVLRGGSGHSSILAQYMPQLGRKQSKKHRRKYAKGRTARR